MDDKLEKERLELLRKRYEENPNDYDNAISLAECYSDRGWLTESRELYEELYKKDPNDYSIILAYGNICFNKGEKESAISLFAKLTELKPTRVEGWNNLGIAQIESGDSESAYRSFMKILEIEPDNYGALLNLGNYFDSKGEFDKSSEYFKKVTEIRPDFRDGWFNYGNALLKHGDINESISAFERSLKYDPLFASSLKNIGYANELLDNNEKALEFYKKAIAQDRTDASLYSNIANVYIKMGQIDESSDFYRKAVSLAPRESTGWMGIRELSLIEGNMGIYAKSTLAVLHRLDGDEIATTIFILRKTGDFSSINKIIKMADKLKISGDAFNTQRLLALIDMGKSGKNTDSLYTKILAIKDKKSETIRALFRYCVSESLYEKAIRWYNKLIPILISDRIKIWKMKIENGNINDVHKEIKKFLSEHPDEAEVWFLLSVIYSEMQELDNAKKSFVTALKKGFTDEKQILLYSNLSAIYKDSRK